MTIGPPTGRTPDHEGRVDVAFNVSRAAAAQNLAPVHVARQIADALADLDLVAGSWASGPFVNVRLDDTRLAHAVLAEIDAAGATYGRHRSTSRDFVILDYSHPNIAKN